ncbi:tyrosine-type recombinase/integrase [Streptacidiphilus sp. BW17]|uniref:tyrosine-type recombinase/integrase n=1 Tax=Streptacidiphilus sp. BW17 TaxID=3156274 RepID=UPI003518A495
MDLPGTDRRTTVRRGGFPTEQAARAALRRLLEGTAVGFNADPNQTLADYLSAWLEAKQLLLKPTTFARYRDYVANDLIPALGDVLLDDLGYAHLAGYVHTQLERGRGKVTVHQILATLSSALGDAVRHHRLARNLARPTVIPRPAAAERHIWTPDQAARFLRCCHTLDPLFADLVEVIIGTGLRKGEALGLHWDDIHLTERILFVRCTLSAVDNNRLVLTSPKTRSSKTWVALSDRVAHALEDRAAADDLADGGGDHGGFVFSRAGGRPLHPACVLRRFYWLCDKADVPRCAIHDLRHLAATISITNGVPLTVVSKTLRHATLSTTANIYAHLTAQAARQAVYTIDDTLDRADRAVLPTVVALRAVLRPQDDHIAGHRNQLIELKPIPGQANCDSRSTRLPRGATTLRPPGAKTTKRPSPPLGGNGLRPAKTLVGTTGFEPATP